MQVGKSNKILYPSPLSNGKDLRTNHEGFDAGVLDGKIDEFILSALAKE